MKPYILLVEDNPDDIELTQRAFAKNHIINEVVVLKDGAEACDFLFESDRDGRPLPQVILLDLKLKKIRPLTNNPRKLVGLEGYGLVVEDRVAIVSPETDENAAYLDTKREKLGHLMAS